MKLNIQGWNCKNPIHQENDLKIATKRNMTKFDTKLKWKKYLGWNCKKKNKSIKKTILNKTNNNSKNEHQI
jgi:hypothetical protein